MAEFKRVFSKAIMNKDMDERLVPNGQYRDANNIEISTSEASEVGTVQTLLGNTQRNTKVAGNLSRIPLARTMVHTINQLLLAL